MNLSPINGKYLTDEDVPQYNTYVEEIFGCADGIQRCFNVSFLVTEDCNLRCSYCYQHDKRQRKMTKDVAKQAVDMLFDNKRMAAYYDITKSDGIILDFIGGEPFLEINLIDYITEYFKYKAQMSGHPWKDGYMLSFSTNGTLYSTPDVQSYIKRNSSRASIGITVDGNEQLHDACRKFENGEGSYALASSALRSQISLNPYASTKLTLCPDNVMYLFEAVKNLYEDIGCHFVHANCVFEEGWTAEHAMVYYQQLIMLADYMLDNKIYSNFYCSLFDKTVGLPENDLSQNWCGGTGSMLAIGVDGTCYPCLRFAPNSLGGNREPFVVGNVVDGLAYNSTLLQKCNKLKCVTLETQSPQKCLECDISSGCSLCSAYNYEKFGDVNVRATFICEMHKARVKANQYYWSRIKD